MISTKRENFQIFGALLAFPHAQILGLANGNIQKDIYILFNELFVLVLELQSWLHRMNMTDW